MNTNDTNATPENEAPKSEVGFAQRAGAWIGRNKWKILGGVGAAAVAGVGIYFLTKDGGADAVATTVGDAATTAADAVVEVAASTAA